MHLPARTSLVLAAVAALSLTFIEFELALSAAGPYKSLRQVQVGAFIGIGLGYFVALLLLTHASRRIAEIATPAFRRLAWVLLTTLAACSVLASPLLAALALTAGCKTEILCPNVANPVLWSYLRVVTELPIAPAAAGIAIVVLAAFTPRTAGIGRNAA